jgi:hypothetical protein
MQHVYKRHQNSLQEHKKTCIRLTLGVDLAVGTEALRSGVAIISFVDFLAERPPNMPPHILQPFHLPVCLLLY